MSVRSNDMTASNMNSMNRLIQNADIHRINPKQLGFYNDGNQGLDCPLALLS